ncbi:MAG TPA: hypothetical protein P5121_09920 [Caldilineaceae bacterium]|nr:hypothetical protein [Caldilineaceae bacterium]
MKTFFDWSKILLSLLIAIQVFEPLAVFAMPHLQNTSLQECDVITEETLQDELNKVTQDVVATASAELNVSRIVATQWQALEMDRVIEREVDAAVERVKSREDYWNKFLSGWSIAKAEELTRAITNETFDSPNFHAKIDELSKAVAQQIGEEIAVISAQSVSAAFFCLQTFIDGNYSGALVSTFEEEVRLATEDAGFGENGALDSSLLTVASQHKSALGGVGVIIVAQVSRRILIELGESISERIVGRIVGRVLGKAGSTIIPIAGWLVGAGMIAYDVYSNLDGAIPEISNTLKSEEVKAGIRGEITASIEPELKRELPQIAREVSNQLYNEWRDVKRNIRQVLELANENAAFQAILSTLETPQELAKLVDLVGILLPTVGRDGILAAVEDQSLEQLLQLPEAAFQIIADTGSIQEALTWSATVGTQLNDVVKYEIYKHQPPDGLDTDLLEKLLALDNEVAIEKLVLLPPETLQTLLQIASTNLVALSNQLTPTDLTALAGYIEVLDQEQRNQLVARISSNPETVAQLSDETVRTYLATNRGNFDEALGFLLSPKEGMAAFNDVTKVATGAIPWQLFFYKYGTGQSLLVSGAMLLAALVLIRLIFGAVGWLLSPITGLFRR